MDRQKSKERALLLVVLLVMIVVFGIFRTTEKEVQELKQEATQEQSSSRLEILASNLEIPLGSPLRNNFGGSQR